jgi:MerR family mercuric resistance operon transcriptional regulator
MLNDNAFIGEVARRTGLSIHAIRFYESQRILREPARTESGYRVYSAEAVEDLKFVRKTQELGFSLKEIRELLVLKRRGAEACAHVKALLEEKLAQVRSKKAELEAMEGELSRALAGCRAELRRRNPEPHDPCPVLAKLGRTSVVGKKVVTAGRREHRIEARRQRSNGQRKG